MTRGRPQGTTKDPNRRRIRNHNGRLIDFEGLQFNRLINSGYMLNQENTRLVLDNNFTGDRNARNPVGRPPNRPRVITNEEKVKNPDTKRFIIKSGAVFKKLTKIYHYDPSRNKFNIKIFDPKSETRIMLHSPRFKNRIDSGYVYKKVNNTLIKPSIKREHALKEGVIVYDLAIISKMDPDIQVS